MKLGEKELGVVVSVDSDEATVGMYNVTNGASYFMDGEEVNGIKVGAYAILKQGRNRIVVTVLSEKVRDQLNTINSKEIIYVFLTIFLYLLKCPQSLILSALRAFCFCGKPHISRSIFLYFRYQSWLKSW